MDAIRALKNELQAQIAEGETERALEQLLSLYGRIEGEYHDELILLKSQLKELRDQQLAGTIGQEAAAVRYNMIKHGLLRIVEGLNKDDRVRRHFGAPSRKEPATAKDSRRRVPSWIVGVLAGLVVALLALVLIGPMMAPRPAEASEPAEAIAEKEGIPPEEEKQAGEPAPADEEQEKKQPSRQQEEKTTDVAPPTEGREDENKPAINTEEQKETEPAPVPAAKPEEKKKAGPGEAEPNDEMSAAQTIGINQPVACYLGASGDVDYFQVNITQPGKYVAHMRDAAPALAGVIDVYNERQLRLGRYTNRTPGAAHTASFRAQKTGLHYIRVSARKGAGGYTLEVKPE